MLNVIFEVCAGSYEDCLIAQLGGADRIELNSALYLGGLTPSIATVQLVKRDVHLPIAAMVRPRAGGFCYSEHEYEVMKEDAVALLELQVEGIVFGFLKEDFTVDEQRTREFVKLIHQYGKEAIFHRAFDVSKDKDEAIQTLIKCGIDRVLTSGLAPTAVEGKENLKQLQTMYGEQIEILAGVGLNSQNVKEVIAYTEVKQVHSSCKGWKKDPTAKQGKINYGYDNNHEDSFECVEEELVKKFAKEIR